MSPKKIPLRTCIVCRQAKEKSQLMRVVKQKTGDIFIDTTFKADGRGAYICKDKECVLKAQKSGALSRAFKCPIDPSLYEQLVDGVEK